MIRIQQLKLPVTHTQEELEQKIFSREIEDTKTISALLAYKVKYQK